MERDIKTRQIEDNVNEELNAIEDYEKLKNTEKIEHKERQIKMSDLKGLRD